MPDRKISETAELALVDVQEIDVLPIVSTGASPDETQKITITTLRDIIAATSAQDIIDLQNDKYDKVGGAISGLVTANNGITVANQLLSVLAGCQIAGVSGLGLEISNGNINFSLSSKMTFNTDNFIGFMQNGVPIFAKLLSGVFLANQFEANLPHGLSNVIGNDRIIGVTPTILDVSVNRHGYNPVNDQRIPISVRYDATNVIIARGATIIAELTVLAFIIYRS